MYVWIRSGVEATGLEAICLRSYVVNVVQEDNIYTERHIHIIITVQIEFSRGKTFK